MLAKECLKEILKTQKALKERSNQPLQVKVKYVL